jgi:hypothetical protein
MIFWGNKCAAGDVWKEKNDKFPILIFFELLLSHSVLCDDSDEDFDDDAQWAEGWLKIQKVILPNFLFLLFIW